MKVIFHEAALWWSLFAVAIIGAYSIDLLFGSIVLLWIARFLSRWE